MSYFDELVLCMKEQGLLIFNEPFELVEGEGKRFYIDMIDVMFMRRLEKEIKNE